jgi:hypothetical protein
LTTGTIQAADGGHAVDTAIIAIGTALCRRPPSSQYDLGTDPFALGIASCADGFTVGIELTAIWQFWLELKKINF